MGNLEGSMMVYEGPATMVASNGAELDLAVKLHVKVVAVHLGEDVVPLRSWRGEGHAQPGDWDASLGPARLRLPDGGEGAIVISEDRFARGAATVMLLFAGQGPYPQA